MSADRALSVLRGRPLPPQSSPQPATVRRVTAGRLFVALEASPAVELEVLWSRPALPVTSCGDASHTHPQPDPPRGTRCLVWTVGADTWLLAFHAWPP